MVSIALVTTTINIPHVLRRYREIGPDVAIIVAGDMTTDPGCPELCEEIGARYLGPIEQEKLYPALSDLIGWRSIQRRNIATLEAIRSGADIVVSIDDDNEPVTPDYFRIIDRVFAGDMHIDGLASGYDWFNPGVFGATGYYYRGYPYSLRGADSSLYVRPGLAMEWDGRVGVLNGLVMGDPDINATERMERHPDVKGYRANKPIAINPRETWAPINSQNTAYVRELSPLSAVIPGIGRYDDVWGSYVAQAVMRATDYHVAYGPPFVRQERNPHNLISDLKAELYGMEHTEAFTAMLRAIGSVAGASVVNELSDIAALLGAHGQWSHIGRFYDIWLDAVAEVL